MKKFFLTVCCLMVASVAMAQSDTVANVKNVYVTQDADRGRILLTVGGYQVGLTSRTRPKYAAAGTVVMSEAQVERLARQNPKYLVDGCVVSEDIMKRIELRKRRSRVEVSIGFRAMELGFSLLTSPGYGAYPAAERGFLDQWVGKSIHFGFRLLDLGFNLNEKRTLQLHTGLHLMCDNYVFDKNVTLRRVDETVVPEVLDRDYKKSKLTTASFGIPLELTYMPVYELCLSAQVYGDVVFNSHTKYKKPITKDRFSGVNVFQAGVGASITYKGVGLYAKYGLTEFFRGDVAPVTHPWTVGITCNLYFGI